jgi:ribose transport system permease protein
VRRAGGIAVLVGAWAALVVGFGFAVPGGSFWTPENLQTVLRQTAIVGVAAIGMTFVIVRGAIDLSVGSTVALVTVVVAKVLSGGGPVPLAVAAGLATGVLVGLANGLIVTGFRVSPFIATLGTLLVVRGVAKGLANEQKVDAAVGPLQSLLAKLPAERAWMLVPPGVWLMLVAAVVGGLVLRRTVFGRAVVAEGSNEEAARLAGLGVRGDLVAVFALGGLFAGVAGLMQFSRLTVGDPTVAVGLELDVVAAAVIGGASLAGGQGSVGGALMGALVMATIRAGCSQMGLPNWVQEIVTGFVLVTAVALDRWRNRR